MPNSFSLPFFSTIEFLVFIFLIYLVVRVTVKIISYISVLRKPYILIKKIIPVLDLAFVLTIIFWFIYRIFQDSDLLPIIIAAAALILLCIVGWFWGRDFIAGIILKSENYFGKNKKIRVINKSGRITKTTLRYLEFETEEGETIRVPFSRISGEAFSMLSPSEKYESHSITLQVNEAKDTKALRETLKKIVYNSPWYLAGKEPVIEIISSDGGGYKINLSVYTLNSSHTDLIRQDLITGLEE